MARPFRLFSIYDFFSVFVPGLATLMGFYMLLPREINTSLVAALIPVLVLSFVFGQALHSFSAYIQSKFGDYSRVISHRTLFADKIMNPSSEEERIIQVFKDECSLMFRDPSLLGENEDTPDEEIWKGLYPTIQSYIYTQELGRSRTFQAIYSFSRSIAVLLTGLPILYLIHYSMKESGILFDRPTKYLIYFGDFGQFIEVALPLCWLGAILFYYSTYSYKRYFIQYLISDFVNLRLAKYD